MTQIARRTGWKSRRSLHVINAKTPDALLVRDPAGAYGYAHYESWPDQLFDDEDCRYPCCFDEDWAVYVMPSMIFSQDGLVHVSKPKEPMALCGDYGNWPVPPLASTDEAIAYAKKFRGDFRQVTCLACITFAHFWNIAWEES